VAAEQETGGVVIWEACRAVASSAKGAGFLGRLVGVAVSHQDGACPSGAPVVPHGAGARKGLMLGWGSSPPTYGWGSAEPEGLWVQGEGWVSPRAVGPIPG
jgi:hypothetical protein